LEREIPNQVLLAKTFKRWRGLLYAIHKEDREHHLRMCADCHNSLKDAAKTELDCEISVSF